MKTYTENRPQPVDVRHGPSIGAQIGNDFISQFNNSQNQQQKPQTQAPTQQIVKHHSTNQINDHFRNMQISMHGPSMGMMGMNPMLQQPMFQMPPPQMTNFYNQQYSQMITQNPNIQQTQQQPPQQVWVCLFYFSCFLFFTVCYNLSTHIDPCFFCVQKHLC